MTNDELIEWGVSKYFGDWELKAAKEILEKHGKEKAIEYLRSNAAESMRGSFGPDVPGYDTRGGIIGLYMPETQWGNPDIKLDIKQFSGIVVDRFYQPTLF